MGDPSDAKTKEAQYQVLLEQDAEFGKERLGLMTAQVWRDDPRRLTFLLSRYKFVSKMFSGFGRVLEVGCGDGFGARVVAQEVSALTVTDFDPLFVRDIQERGGGKWSIQARVHDFLSSPYPETGFDGVYALDVLEHVEASDEDRFLRHVTSTLSRTGVCILGMPSLQSQAYASPQSREGHVNCKDAGEFKKLMQRYFDNVFIFSMNDEVVHTGFTPMAHYLFALCCKPK